MTTENYFCKRCGKVVNPVVVCKNCGCASSTKKFTDYHWLINTHK